MHKMKAVMLLQLKLKTNTQNEGIYAIMLLCLETRNSEKSSGF